MKKKHITVQDADRFACRDLIVPEEWTVSTVVELVRKELSRWMLYNRIRIETEGDDGTFGTCPNCDQSVPKYTTTVEPTKFCPHCGQALEWAE